MDLDFVSMQYLVPKVHHGKKPLYFYHVQAHAQWSTTNLAKDYSSYSNAYT